jgi:hypothetical protein
MDHKRNSLSVALCASSAFSVFGTAPRTLPSAESQADCHWPRKTASATAPQHVNYWTLVH